MREEASLPSVKYRYSKYQLLDFQLALKFSESQRLQDIQIGNSCDSEKKTDRPSCTPSIIVVPRKQSFFRERRQPAPVDRRRMSRWRFDNKQKWSRRCSSSRAYLQIKAPFP